MQKLDTQFIQKVRLQDRIATRIITFGGLLVIASVIAILVLIVRVTIPLFQPARTNIVSQFPLSSGSESLLAMGVDDYQETAFTLNDRGVFTFYNLAKGTSFLSLESGAGKNVPLKSLELHKNNQYSMLWADNSVSMTEVAFRFQFDKDGKRTIKPEIKTIAEFPAETGTIEMLRVAVRKTEDGRLTKVVLLDDNSFRVAREVMNTDLFGNEKKEDISFPVHEDIPGKVTAFTLDEKGDTLFVGTDSGSLLRWDVSGDAGVRTDNVLAVPSEEAITALTMVFGDISVAVGDAKGGLATWSPIWTGDGAQRITKLRKIHELTPHKVAVATIVASRRTKALVSIGVDGRVHYDHMTSENHLLDIEHNLTNFALAGSDSSLIGLDRNNNLIVWNIDNPHPEVSLKTLFGKVWYESYNQPEYVWQSSGGSDDFEPKFSIIPLLFGTIKGTLYAMIFAIPLSIFGAVYTSQFTSYGFKKNIKPLIEIMASVPSVVIGFLIALWLGPVIEKFIVEVLLFSMLLPLVLLIMMTIMQPYYKTPTLQNRCNGYEFLLLVPVIVSTVGLAVWMAPGVEKVFFSGDFLQWLYSDLGVRYDQRNSIIIAFGLGIAVIPIIFSITEDAISNIPSSLTGASLALGASRWQTIWRVVLPSASPGIFAAIMIGFGRAVGETMIVLMATGNTPIMDWSIFNGMRTLSANIAVEIPEAPFNGTLYRVLFLCATLLFALTFILNTGAEVIRERLRKKYGRY
ncbi:MAG: ABC transporter permease subunit [Proteobacteria bacterium]|nr:ABC transporter permease subunit [Pseudomonadota bacterium]MBU1648554.1 ABC transporter permease subunit [Pseudomonadota bacterium]